MYPLMEQLNRWTKMIASKKPDWKECRSEKFHRLQSLVNILDKNDNKPKIWIMS